MPIVFEHVTYVVLVILGKCFAYYIIELCFYLLFITKSQGGVEYVSPKFLNIFLVFWYRLIIPVITLYKFIWIMRIKVTTTYRWTTIQKESNNTYNVITNVACAHKILKYNE